MRFSIEEGKCMPMQLALKALDSAESLRRGAADLSGNCNACTGSGGLTPQQEQAEADSSFASEVVTLTIRVITYCIFNGRQWRNDKEEGLIPSTSSMESYIRKMRLNKFETSEECEQDINRAKSLDDGDAGDAVYPPFGITWRPSHSPMLQHEAPSSLGIGRSQSVSPNLRKETEKNSQDTPSTPAGRKTGNVPSEWKDGRKQADVAEALSPSLSSMHSYPFRSEPSVLDEPMFKASTTAVNELGQFEQGDKMHHGILDLPNERLDNKIEQNGKLAFQPRPMVLSHRSKSAPYPGIHDPSRRHTRQQKEQCLLLQELSDILLRICIQVDNLAERKPNYYGNTFHMPPLLSELAMLKSRANMCLDRLTSGKSVTSDCFRIDSGRNAPTIDGEGCHSVYGSAGPFAASPHFLQRQLLRESPIQEITGRIFWEDECCGGDVTTITPNFITWQQFVQAFERVYGTQQRSVLERLHSILGTREEVISSSDESSDEQQPYEGRSRGRVSEQNTLQKLRNLCLSPSRRKRKVRIQRWIRKNAPNDDCPEGEGACSCTIHSDEDGDSNMNNIDGSCSTLVALETFARFCTDHRGLYEGFIAATDPGTHIECLGSVEDLSKEELHNLGNIDNVGDNVAQTGDSNENGFVFRPTIVRELLGLKILQLSCGGQHAAILIEGGEIHTWGKGGFGRLGHGDSRPCTSPRKVSMPHQCVQVACGFAYTAVVTSCGQVYAWGAGENGRLGVGDEHDRNRPTRVLLRNQIKVHSVYAGSVHTCVLTSEGEVFSFGKHEYTGHGSSNDIFVPRRLDAFGPEKISQMSVGPGGYHTIALTKDHGMVYTWGHNRVGQLGFPISEQNANTEGGYFIPKPTLVKSIAALDITQVVAGWGHSAVVTRHGAVYTCGRNFQGQLGLGEPDFSTVNERGHPYQSCFLRVRGELSHKHVIQFACGGEHSIALTKKGELFAFGKGHKGQLGIASSETQYLPAKVDNFGTDGRNTLQVACGNNCTLVLRGRYTVPSLFTLCRERIISSECFKDKSVELPPMITSIMNIRGHDDGVGGINGSCERK